VLACGEDSALSHRPAGALWGIWPYRGTVIDVTVPTVGGRGPRKGIRVRRSRHLAPGQVTIRDGIPVTTPARTVLDLTTSLELREVERVIDEAHYRGLVEEEALRAVLAANPGHHGAGALSDIVSLHEPGSTLTRSDVEELVLALCRERGFDRPLVNERVLGHEVDFHWPEARLIVEVDAWGSHGRRRNFEEDRVKDTRLAVAGWKVIRPTRRRLAQDLDGVGDDVEALLQPERRSISSTL